MSDCDHSWLPGFMESLDCWPGQFRAHDETITNVKASNNGYHIEDTTMRVGSRSHTGGLFHVWINAVKGPSWMPLKCDKGPSRVPFQQTQCGNISRLSVALSSKPPLRSHVHELTFTLGSGRDGGGVTAAGCRARGRSSRWRLSVKPLHFFWQDVGTFPGHVCGDKDRYFKIRIISS